MFNSIGPVEMLVVFIIVLMVFGADEIPELARGLGKGIREFKRAANMVRNEILSETDNLKIGNPIKKEIDEISDTLKSDPILNMDVNKDQPQNQAKTIEGKKSFPKKTSTKSSQNKKPTPKK